MNVQRIIFVVNLILITLGAYFGAGLCYRIWGLQVQPSQLSPVGTARASAAPEAVARPFNAYSPIFHRDLFKTQKSAAVSPPADKLNVEEMEETKLQLKLWGTVTGDSRQSYAVIEDVQKREQNLYRVGDSIQDAAVKAILREKVILTVNGQDEVLAMEEIQKSGPPQRPFPRGPRPVASAPSGPMRTQRVSLRRSMIDDAIQDVSKLMTEIKIQPNESGLALSDIKPNSIFRRMGLRNGDVLRSVDGQEIHSVDDALKLYESLKSADSVNVVLQRRGSERSINYNIR